MSAPLARIRVLELGRMFSAPWAGQLLADMGAEVIKVEAAEGDITRKAGGVAVKDGAGRPAADHSTFVSVNRNKRSIVVDLAHPQGLEVIRGLARASDVLLENFKAGDLDRRGLGPEALRALNPELVYLSLSGFGQTGPYRRRPAMDSVVQAMSGYLDISTGPDGTPRGSPIVINDFAAGMYAFAGVMTALYHRDVNGGTGQHIDLSLLEAGVAMLSFRLQASLLADHQMPAEVSSRFSPAGLYEAADGRFQIAISPQPDFVRFAAALGRPELANDPRFASNEGRLAHRQALDEVLRPIFLQETLQTWLDRFAEANIMFSPIYSFAQMAEDPHVRARDLFVTVPHGAGGEVPLIRNPLRMSQTPVETYAPPPLLGEHTAEVLARVLGYDAERIASLQRSGAVGGA